MSDDLPPPTVRAMARTDLDDCMKLTELAGWNQLRGDWETFLALRPDGCFVACLDGSVVGTATTTVYGDSFGWIGMVIVHPDCRRRGVGRSLLTQCVASLGHCAAAKLDATPTGKRLYDSLGFVDELTFGRYVAVQPRVPDCLAGVSVTALRRSDLAAVAAFDRPRFGADRGAVLGAWLRRAPEYSLVARRAGEVAGYSLGRPGLHYETVGPVVARDEDVARALVAGALSRMGSRPVVLDAFEHTPTFVEWLGGIGFAKQRPFIRMYRGANSHPGDVREVFAVCGPEVG